MNKYYNISPFIERATLKDIQQLVAEGFSINATPEDPEPPLSTAIYHDRQDVVDYLLTLPDIDVNAMSRKSGKNIPIIFLAVQKGNLSTIKKLIKKDVHILETKAYGQTLLFAAAKDGKWDVVDYLLTLNDIKGALSAAEMPIVVLAAKARKLDIVMKLLGMGVGFNEFTPNEHLEEVAKFLGTSCIHNIKNDPMSKNTLSNIIYLNILIRKELYRRMSTKNEVILIEESDEHDVTFAKKALGKTKEYFKENNLKDIPEFSSAVEDIQQILIDKIKDSTASEVLKESLKPFNNEDFMENFDKNDATQLAFLWAINFQDDLELEEHPDPLIQEMISYIVACINNIKINGDDTVEYKKIENALILQLGNLMQSNEGLMSCAPGTPRGLKDILNVYLQIKDPIQFQHENIKQSTFAVINKLMLDTLKDSKATTEIKQVLDEKAEFLITTLSKHEIEQINKAKATLTALADLMAGIGSDNISDPNIIGRASGKELEAKHLALRIAKIQKKYPTYNDFESAVLANMPSSPAQKIFLTAQDKAYLQLAYVAVSDAEIRPMLYNTLDAELLKIKKDIDKMNLPSIILNAISAYKADSGKLNELKLKNVLGQAFSLLIKEGVNLEARDNVILKIFDEIPNYRNNLSILDVKLLLDKLKTNYDIEVNPPDRPGFTRRM